MNFYGYLSFANPLKTYKSHPTYKQLRAKFVLAENIYVDLLSVDGRSHLDSLLETACPGDVIAIPHRRTLGTTPEFRKLWKRIVFENRLNLLIINDADLSGVDRFSTIDFSFIPYSEDEINIRWAEILAAPLERQSDVVGRHEYPISDTFKKVYWLYQLFIVMPEDAMQYLGVSKQCFYDMSNRYEMSYAYRDDLITIPNIMSFPRRGSLPKDIDNLFVDVEYKKVPLEDACFAHNMKVYSEEEYQRLLLAKQGGRSLALRLGRECRDANAISKLGKVFLADNNPNATAQEMPIFEQLRKCGVFPDS